MLATDRLEPFDSLLLEDLDLMIVENLGNLICPASFKLGTHANALISSIPDGDDKPHNYPGLYRGVEALILNKMDLLQYVKFDWTISDEASKCSMPGLAFFPLSCTPGQDSKPGLIGFAKEWLK